VQKTALERDEAFAGWKLGSFIINHRARELLAERCGGVCTRHIVFAGRERREPLVDFPAAWIRSNWLLIHYQRAASARTAKDKRSIQKWLMIFHLLGRSENFIRILIGSRFYAESSDKNRFPRRAQIVCPDPSQLGAAGTDAKKAYVVLSAPIISAARASTQLTLS